MPDFATEHPLFWVPKMREELLAVVLCFRKTREGSEASLGHLDLNVHPSPGHLDLPWEAASLCQSPWGWGGKRDPSGHCSPETKGSAFKTNTFYMAKLPQLPPELAQYRHLWLGWEDFLRIDFTNWFCFALAVGWAVGMPQWNKRKHSSSQTRLSKPCKPTQANSHAAAELR